MWCFLNGALRTEASGSVMIEKVKMYQEDSRGLATCLPALVFSIHPALSVQPSNAQAYRQNKRMNVSVGLSDNCKRGSVLFGQKSGVEELKRTDHDGLWGRT